MSRKDIFVPKHRTNNLILRWIANNMFSKTSMFFFNISLNANYKIYELEKSNKFDEFVEWSCAKLYNLLNIPYDKWGTYYEFRSPEDLKDVLDKIGSDYDEHGVPYWEKWEHQEDKDKKDGTITPAIKKALDNE